MICGFLIVPPRRPASVSPGPSAGDYGRRRLSKEVIVHAQVLVAGAAIKAAPPTTDTLFTACGRTQNPGIACRMVWDVTHSTKAADLTMVYFAGPAQLVVRIALVLRLIAHRAIGRVTARATRESAEGGDRTHAVLFRERRLQRASALG